MPKRVPGQTHPRGLSSTSKVENLWTTRLGTAYCQRLPFSLIVVALCAVQNSSHLLATDQNQAVDAMTRSFGMNKS